MQIAAAPLDGMVEALAQALAVNGPFILSVLSRVFHIGSAIIIGGGMFYMRTILAPSGADACFANRRELWAKWVGIATFLLLASGIFNLVRIIQQAKAIGVEIPGTYHALFGVKFLLAIFVMFVAAILSGKTAAADRFRVNISKWLNLGWSAVLAIVVIGAILRSIRDSLLLEAIAQ